MKLYNKIRISKITYNKKRKNKIKMSFILNDDISLIIEIND